MKLVSGYTLALVAAIGMSATLSVPSVQAAKAKPAKVPSGPTPELSAPFRKAFGELQATVKAANPVDIQAKLTATEPFATLPDEKFYLAVMRLELAKITKEKATTRTAVLGMISSGSKLITNLPDLYYNAGAMAYDAGEYPDALIKFAEADRLGSKDINRLILPAEISFKISKIPEGIAFLNRAIAERTASGQAAPEDWYKRGVAFANKSRNVSLTNDMSRAWVRAYPNVVSWREALALYRDTGKIEPLVQLDVFRLMRQTKSLTGERDFFDYAAVANERALPGEAQSVIEEGYASLAVPKSSKPVAEMLTLASGKLASDRVSVAADEKRARAGGEAKLTANTGNAYLAYGNYDKAIELLRLALTRPGVDADTVNTRLGIALTKAGQKAEARNAFGLVKGVRAETAKFWMLYLDLNP